MTDFTKPLLRLNYFDGLELDAKDFLLEQEYHRRKQEMHNLGLHSPGVVFGLQLEVTAANEVSVSPGLAIDAAGRELYLAKSKITDQRLNDVKSDRVYVGLRFAEGEAGANGASANVSGDYRIDPTNSKRSGLPYREELANVTLQPFAPKPEEGVLLGRLDRQENGAFPRGAVDSPERPQAGAKNGMLELSSVFESLPAAGGGECAGLAIPGRNEVLVDSHAADEDGINSALDSHYIAIVVPSGVPKKGVSALSWSIEISTENDDAAGPLVKVSLVITNERPEAVKYRYQVRKMVVGAQKSK